MRDVSRGSVLTVRSIPDERRTYGHERRTSHVDAGTLIETRRAYLMRFPISPRFHMSDRRRDVIGCIAVTAGALVVETASNCCCFDRNSLTCFDVFRFGLKPKVFGSGSHKVQEVDVFFGK